MIAKPVITDATTEFFRLAVDWNRTTEEMVEAGNYDYPNPDITEGHFPRPRTSGVEEGDYKLFHFDRNTSSDEAVRKMGAEWESAGPHETLAYGEKFPETQREFPVVGLGEPVWMDGRGRCHVVELFGHDSARNANLEVWRDVRHLSYRFLARRK